METQAAEERQRLEEERLVDEKTRKRTESIASGMDKDNQQHQSQQEQQQQQQQPPTPSETTATTTEGDRQSTPAPSTNGESIESTYHLINEAAAQVVEDLIRRVAVELDGVDESLETLTLTDNSLAVDGEAATAAAVVDGADRLTGSTAEDPEDANWATTTTAASTPVDPVAKSVVAAAGGESSGSRTPTGSVATHDTGLETRLKAP